jgi:hypothetical protein
MKDQVTPDQLAEWMGYSNLSPSQKKQMYNYWVQSLETHYQEQEEGKNHVWNIIQFCLIFLVMFLPFLIKGCNL